MNQTCVVDRCARPTETYLCAGCLAEVVTALRELAAGPPGPHGDPTPGLLADLEDVVIRLTRSGLATGILPTRPHVTPLPFHSAASDLMWTAGNTISTWARDIAEMNPHLHLDATTTAEAAGWLGRLPALIAMHPAADELHDEITWLTDRVRSMVDIAPIREYLGQCGAEPDGHLCTEDLYALPGSSAARCRVCGAVWDIATRKERLLGAVVDQWATATEIARALSLLGQPITVARIGMWVRRGKLTARPPHPLDPRRRPRYRVGDVVDRALKAARPHQG